MLLEGFIEFENQIPVGIESLGKEYRIVIGGIPGLLATPSMYKGFGSDQKKLGPLQPPKPGKVKYRSHMHWGSVSSWPDGDSQIRACKILFPDIDEQTFEENGNEIALALPKWRNLLIDNISLMLEQDYRGTQRAITAKSYGLGEFDLFRKGEGGYTRFRPKVVKYGISMGTVGKGLGFGVDGFQLALDETSEGKAPLLPFYLLFDAERAQFEGNYRKSVLDCATAVEVCFSFLISKLLPFDDDLNKHVAGEHRSSALKRKLLKALKVPMALNEGEYKNDLDAVRNKVIHAGYFPNANEANAAYRIASETLYSLLPKKYEL